MIGAINGCLDKVYWNSPLAYFNLSMLAKDYHIYIITMALLSVNAETISNHLMSNIRWFLAFRNFLNFDLCD